MFVKIVRHADPENDVDSVQTIYQCGNVGTRNVVHKAVSKLTGEDVTVKDLLVEMEGCPAPHNDFLAVQCTKEKLSIYIMNDTGKTIDAYEYR